MEIAVYSLARIGGVKRKVATEEIAYEAFQLAPDRFTWVLGRFRRFPDKEVARSALEDAAKAKYGTLVEGNYARDTSKDGWVLTPRGIRWLAENEERIKSALGCERNQNIQLSPREVQRLRARLRRQPAFQIYSSSGSLENVSRFMFSDMLQCSPDAPPDLLRFKFDRLLSQAELAKDVELIRFLRKCQPHFRHLLEKKEDVPNGQEA